MDYIYEAQRIFAENENKQLLTEILLPKRDESRIDIKHVFVDESLRGQGIASKLMQLAYYYIKSQNKQIVAKCPYAINWFKKYPDFQDIVINVKTKKTE